MPAEDAPGAQTTPAAGLQDVLEFLLSKKNLVRDSYLANSMNPQMYISIDKLVLHEQLSKLDASVEDVAAAAERSSKVGLSAERKMVRPLLKSKRNVVILRDVAEGATEAEVRALFGGCPHEAKLKEVRPEVNNTWFVKFDLDDIQDVVLWLRDKKLKGEAVNAFIKSEHFMRSFFPLSPPPAASFPPFLQAAGFEALQPDAAFAAPPVMPPLLAPAMPPPPMAEPGLQPLGFWKPWGSRLQPAPVVLVPQEKPQHKGKGENGKGGKSGGKGGGKGSKGDKSGQAKGGKNGKDAMEGGKASKGSGKNGKDGSTQDASGAKGQKAGAAPGRGQRWIPKEPAEDGR